MTPQWGSLVRSHDKLNKLNLHLQKTNGHQIRQEADLRDRHQRLKPHYPLITWSTWCQLTIWKIYISILIRLMATKLGRVLSYWKRFSIKMLKSSQTYYYFNCNDLCKAECFGKGRALFAQNDQFWCTHSSCVLFYAFWIYMNLWYTDFIWISVKKLWHVCVCVYVYMDYIWIICGCVC